MSWLQIVLVTWAGVGVLAAPVVLCVVLKLSRESPESNFQPDSNPITWIPLAAMAIIVTALPVIVILLFMALVVGPVLGILSGLGWLKASKVGLRARLLDHGLEVLSEDGSVERFVAWPDVERVEEVFTPPVRAPHLILRDGGSVPLHMVTAEELTPMLERHDIPFERRQ